MNSAPQILDFLLGNIKAESKSATPTDKGVNNDLFAQLFGEQLALGDGLPGSVEQRAGLNDMATDGKSSIELGMPVGADDSLASLSTKEMVNGSSVTTGLGMSGDGLPVMGLPLTPAAAQFAINESIGNNIELAAGDYEIQATQIKEGRLELTLSAKDETDNQPLIKLTLSAEAVSKMFKNVTAVNSESTRVALNGIDEQIAHLKSVLADINLKELKVELDGNTELKNSTNLKSGESSTNITLVAESSGQAMSIKSKLNRSDYSARKSNRLVAAKPIMATESGYLPKLGGVKAGMMNLARPNLVTGLADQVFTDLVRAAGDTQIAGNEFINDDSMNELAGLKPGQGAESATNLKPTVLNRPASLILTKDSFMNLRPNGQSITLKIDPEHLGSARLRLILRDNNLIARIVVDNVQAKEMLDKNLDRLVDQLSKAEINVESIEVNVGGEGKNHSSFDQMAFWQQRNQAATKQTGRQSSIGKVEPVSVGYQPPAGYLNSDGVNLLA